MDRKEIFVAIASILTTALEVGAAGPERGLYFPESMAYLAMGGDIHKWEIVRGVMVGCGLITVKGNLIHITSLGREKAKLINDAMATS